jgi:hypothetical protein
MSLDQLIPEDDSYPRGGTYFTGILPSILGRIMHANKYRVVTGYTSYFLGAPGPYVDHFLTPGVVTHLGHTTLCIGSKGSYRMKVRMLFACPTYVTVKDSNSPLFPYLFYPQVYESQSSWHDIIIKHIINTANKNKPTLSFLYTFRPLGHTWPDYNHNNIEMKEVFKKFYFEGAILLNNQLKEIYYTVQKHDPTAIVIVFGDHGAFTSRAIKENDNPRFFYVDRHKIMMAVMNTRHKCAESRYPYYTKEYATPSRLILDMISCLSGNKPLPKELINFDENSEVIKNVLGIYDKNTVLDLKP